MQASFAAPQCSDLFATSESVHQEYKVESKKTIENVFGSQFSIIRFPGFSPNKKYFSYDFGFKSFFTMKPDEIFAKMIKPAIINNYTVERYRLNDFLNPVSNEVLVGFDKNHTYLLIYDQKDKKFIRADAGPDVSFSLIRDSKNVNSGMFLRFKNISDKNTEELKRLVKQDQKFATCSHGVCTVLENIKIKISDGKHTPTSTFELIKELIKQEVRISDPHVTVEIFTLDSKSIEVQMKEANYLSQINADIRERSLKGYLILIKSYGKTTRYWLFNKLGLLNKSLK